jgi:hypothetical protein
MISRWMLAAAPLLAAFPSNLQAQPAPQPAPSVTAGEMLRHIEVLASDDYEGRKPGTPSENKTLLYIASQLAARGLDPAGVGGWYQPVGLVERKPSSHRVSWNRGGEGLGLEAKDFVLVGRQALESIADAPVYFVGHGLVMPAAGIDQLAGVDLAGAIVFLWTAAPDGVENVPRFSDRVAALAERGAVAVIGLMDEDASWPNVVSFSRARSTSLSAQKGPPISGVAPYAVISRLSGGAVAAGPGSDPRTFRPVRLDARGSLEVATDVRPYTSHNVIGRLRGRGRTGEALLYLGHWDHLGVCRAEGADRICNGAVDNASGIAMLIEIAGHMARGARPERDILFMGTTAEELGLLGAEYFGAHPVVPAEKIVAAINVDTVAIAGRGEPVAIIGRGTAGLDALVDETARELGRRIDTDGDADGFVQRQDGWKLSQAGIPTIMAGGSFANMEKLQAFLRGPYHKPEDDLNRPIELGGAAEDADLMIALGRKLADPKRYQRPPR